MPSDSLLIVDVQQGFINEHTRHIPSMIERLQHDYDSVYVTRFHNPPGSPFRRFLNWDKIAYGSSDTELAFQPRPDATIIQKDTYHCLTPELETDLAHSGTVAICGVDTGACITAIAMELFDAGIRPIVLADVTASTRGEHLHNAALRLLCYQIGTDQIRLTNGQRWLPEMTLPAFASANMTPT